MFRMRKNRTLEYADLAPLACLRMALEGKPAQNRIKHLLIDEMQDYSPIHYKVIQKLFPERKTILGDISQSVNPYISSIAGEIQKSAHYRESGETLQKLPFHLRNNPPRTENPYK